MRLYPDWTKRLAPLSLALGNALVASGCGGDSADGVREVQIEAPPSPAVPAASDWVEVGVVMEGGRAGEWDAIFAGASTPSTLVQVDDGYYLYYGGADGERSTDQGPRHRALGLAVSRDGMMFAKHPRNPVMTHLPHEGHVWAEEEGANSGAVWRDESGSFVMVYGGATAFSADMINSDGCAAVSDDGHSFPKDLCDRKILDHTDPGLYGFGDEIFPVALYRHEGVWYVFYTIGGGPAARDLAVAWGDSLDALDDSTVVVDATRDNPARMSATISWLAPDRILLFLVRGWWPNIRIESRLADPRRPWELSETQEVYDGPLWNQDTKGLSVFLDGDRDRWLLYRSNWQNQLILHTAPISSR